MIHERYRQQTEILQAKMHAIKDLIVSISQPHIRLIVRGKAKAKTEFGAKLSAGVMDGYCYVDRISFDAYTEGEDLPQQIEAYKRRYGHYPASVHAGKIYGTRKNRDYCNGLDIRLSGPRLKRPRKMTPENREQLRAENRQLRQDEIDRIPVEGKFGQAKRKLGLGLLQAKLAVTTKTAIHISFLVMNLEKWLKAVFHILFAALRSQVQPFHVLVTLHSIFHSSYRAEI